MNNNELTPSVVSHRRFSPSKRTILLFMVPVFVLLGAVFLYLHGGRYVETDNAYVKADKTPVAAVVSGRVANVLVRENQPVHKGQLLFILDEKDFQLAVEQAQAHLSDVVTDLKVLKAQYQSQLAQIRVAESRAQFLDKEQTRLWNLLQKNYVSQSNYDSAKRDAEVQKLEINASTKALAQIVVSLGGDVSAPVDAHPKYQTALAQLRQAQNDLQHARVYASDDGVVAKVVEVGEYLATGIPAMTLISQHQLWVEANFTEKEISHMKVGQQVDIQVDYAGDHIWHGKVESISPATGSEFSILPAENATGNWVKITQRLPVRIHLDVEPNAPLLRAGLSAIVTVDTQYQRRLSL